MKTHFPKKVWREAYGACPPKLRRRRVKRVVGFTLVELLIAGVMVGIIFLGIITIFLAGQKSFINTSQQALNQHKANLAMEYIVKGIRESGGVDISVGATFNSASPSDGDTDTELYTLYIDKDSSGDDSNDDEKYKYWLDTSDFKKSTKIYNSGWPASWTDEVITQISGIEFKYCEGPDTPPNLAGCTVDSDGIEIKVTSEDGVDYISKVPYF